MASKPTVFQRPLTHHELVAIQKGVAAMRKTDFDALISSLQTSQTEASLRAAKLQKHLTSKVTLYTPSNGISTVAAQKFITRDFNLNTIPIGSIAKINISGVIMAKGGWCYEGLEDIEKKINAAGSNPNIKGVILDVDSGGGAVDYLEIFANTVGNFENQYGKPIAVYVPNLAASAAYFIIAKAPRIFIGSNLTEIGSIGVMATLYNDTAMLEMEGLTRITVFASQSVNKNRPQLEALDGNTELLQEELSTLQDVFEQTVRAGRVGKINESNRVEITRNGRATQIPEVFTGTIYTGAKIIQMGLADQMGTLDDVVVYVNARALNLVPKNQEDWNNLPSPPSPSIPNIDIEEDDDEEEDDYWAEISNSKNSSKQEIEMAKEAEEKLILALESATEANKQLAKTSMELVAAQGKMNELSSKIADLEKANANADELKNQIEVLASKLANANAENAELKVVAQNTDTYRAKNEELTAQLQAANEKITEKEATIASLQKELKTANKFIAGEDEDEETELGNAADVIGASKVGTNNNKRELTAAQLFESVLAANTKKNRSI